MVRHHELSPQRHRSEGTNLTLETHQITKTTNPYISCLSIDPELGGAAVLQPLNAVAQHETGCFCLTSINCAELIPQPLKRVPRNPLEVAQPGKPDETDDESPIC